MDDEEIMKKDIIIHQTLHGYDHGHDLLASSHEINPESRRTLRVMSDLPGRGFFEGFEEYITGYPLPTMNVYALAKTWYAPEMPRPGSAWTHTLLLNYSDLIQLSDHISLLEFFKRPSVGSDFQFFQKSIRVPSKQSGSRKLSNNFQQSQAFIENLIFHLYGKVDSSVLVPDDNAKNLEGIIMALWTQQWPRLRRNFSFCTGSISPRHLGNKALDLQVVPISAIEQFSKIQNTTILYVNNELHQVRNKRWVNDIYDDLLSPQSHLKDFLSTYGADINNERAAFAKLIELYSYLHHKHFKGELSEVLRFVADRFPESGEAMALKTAVFSNSGKSSFNTQFDEDDLLFQLATTEYSSSYDYEKLDFEKRFQVLYMGNPGGTFSIVRRILDSNINSKGELAIAAIANKIAAKDIRQLNHRFPELLLMFAYFNTRLAYSKQFWALDADEQSERLLALTKMSNIDLDWRKVLWILLDLEAEVDIEIIQDADIEYVPFILDWASKNGSQNLSLNWMEGLKSRPNEVLNWLSMNDQVSITGIALIPQILDPNSDWIKQYKTDLWLKYAKMHKSNNSEWDNTKFKTFILAIAFNNRNKDTLKLLSYSFERAYEATKYHELDYESWKWMEIHTPRLSFWNDWDRSKKLIGALIQLFREMNWPIDYLNKITRNKSLLSKLRNQY